MRMNLNRKKLSINNFLAKEQNSGLLVDYKIIQKKQQDYIRLLTYFTKACAGFWEIMSSKLALTLLLSVCALTLLIRRC